MFTGTNAGSGAGTGTGTGAAATRHDVAPTLEESTVAVVKAVASRRDRHRRNPDHAGLTTSAIAERVTGIMLPPRPGNEGWWLIGRVLDELEEAEYSVWYLPESRRIGISKRPQPPAAAPSPPRNNPYYYDGMRRKWIDAATGEALPDPNRSTGVHESGSRPAT